MTSKFSWEPLDRGSLLLKVTNGDRETTWKLTKRTSQLRHARIMNEVHMALMEDIEEGPVPWKQNQAMSDTLSGLLTNHPISADADTEEASREALRAKAAAVATADGKWWEKTDMAQLDLYVIGHGDEED